MAEDFRRFHFLTADVTRGESVARHGADSAVLQEVLRKVPSRSVTANAPRPRGTRRATRRADAPRGARAAEGGGEE